MKTEFAAKPTLIPFSERSVGKQRVMLWLQLRFDFDSTGDRRAFDCLSMVIKGHDDVSRAVDPLADLVYL